MLLILVSSIVIAQETSQYEVLSQEAFQQLKEKHYQEAAQLYEKAFAITSTTISFDVHYNAACAFALNNQKDKAFEQLSYLTKTNNPFKENPDWLANDDDLNALHEDPRWNVLLNQLHYTPTNKVYNAKLAALLQKIGEKDQLYRDKYIAAEKKYGPNAKETLAIADSMVKSDKENITLVSKIIDEHGWLSSEFVGIEGSQNLFLVIQHADLKTQEKYLPLLQEAVQNGNANSIDLAYLEDRIAVRNGRKQRYGTQASWNAALQTYVIDPIEDEANVNKRRAALGMSTIEAYLKELNLVNNK